MASLISLNVDIQAHTRRDCDLECAAVKVEEWLSLVLEQTSFRYPSESALNIFLSVVFVDCCAIMDHFAWEGVFPSPSLRGSHRQTHIPTAKCQRGLLASKKWHPCCHYLLKACQECFCVNPDKVTWLTDLWAICHPRSDRVRGGDGVTSSTLFCLCACLLQWILDISCLFTQTWVSCQ